MLHAKHELFEILKTFITFNFSRKNFGLIFHIFEVLDLKFDIKVVELL